MNKPVTLIGAVLQSKSFANVARLLGKKGSGSQQIIKKRCIRDGVDFSHFTGQAHGTPKNKVSFTDGSKKVSTHILKLRLFRDGKREKKCYECGVTTWLDKPTPLELHHKDGNRYNNADDNLIILCPNCHALTDTYCKRKSFV